MNDPHTPNGEPCPHCGGLHPRAELGCPRLDTESGPHPVALHEADFAAQIADAELPLVVHFWAPWCAPCRLIKPVFEQAASLRRSLRFATVDTDTEPGLMQSQGITNIPTLAIYFAGRAQARISGTMRLSVMLDWLDRHAGPGKVI